MIGDAWPGRRPWSVEVRVTPYNAQKEGDTVQFLPGPQAAIPMRPRARSNPFGLVVFGVALLAVVAFVIWGESGNKEQQVAGVSDVASTESLDRVALTPVPRDTVWVMIETKPTEPPDFQLIYTTFNTIREAAQEAELNVKIAEPYVRGIGRPVTANRLKRAEQRIRDILRAVDACMDSLQARQRAIASK